MLTQQARAGGTAQSVKAAPNATSADAGDIQTTGNGSVGEVRPPQASSARSASPKGPIEIQDSDSGED